ncbi:MAG: 2-oxoacid:acceptor oxidoreductase family protein, partial [Acidobacteriota bacterium]
MTKIEERPTPQSVPEALGPEFPGIPSAMDGTDAVVAVETAAGEAAGAYPITPATQMGEGWALAAAQGRPNAFGRPLIFFEPEGEHAAAGVTAGLAMMGLRSANFSAGQGVAYMHESLYAAVGKRLTYVLNMACRAMTKHALNVHAGHDDYHAIDDTGFFQLFAKDAQGAADLNLIAHRLAELALNPGVCAQDGFLTSHVIESVLLPEPELVRRYLGDPADEIDSPTPAQRLVFGPERRRIPELFDLDNPAMLGVVQNQESYAQGVASQRPFFFDHVAPLADRAMEEYAALTGRRYARASGYLAEDAEYLLVGQGSVVANAEAVVDHLRATRGLRVGVVDVTMFRPFPADLLAELLRGKKAAVVLERLDQPLAADPPLLREIRSALGRAVENGRVDGGKQAHPGVPSLAPGEVPDLYSACFGMGSRDLQPADLVAAVENMMAGDGGEGDGARGRRHVYLGVEFVRRGRLPEKLAAWQDRVVEAYPRVADLALAPSEEDRALHLLPEGALAVRIHSVGGWGAITMGKNLTMTLFDLLGMHVKSNPKYGSEKKGQPTTFYGVFAHEPIRVNCELRHVDVVLSPDPNVFRHSNPLAGLAPGGTFIIQSQDGGEAVWRALPAWARAIVRERGIRLFHLDAFRIAREETDAADLQFRMQGAAFQGAFFRASPVMEREGLDDDRLFQAIHAQLEKKFGHRGAAVVEDNLRVIRRGFAEVEELDWRRLEEAEGAGEETEATTAAEIAPPWYLDPALTERIAPFADPDRFMHQVCSVYRDGTDPIADPFSALSAIPAATGVFRDMTGIRFEVPELLAERCTGCGQCWTQCPDAAIPGLVVEVERVIRAAAFEWEDPSGGSGGSGHGAAAADRSALERAIRPLAEEARRLLRDDATYTSFAAVVTRAWESIAPKMELPPAELEELEGAVDGLVARLAEFPLARTAPFFTVPERREEGSGGLLAITVNPNACKGCNLCVEVCPDDALYAAPQTDGLVERLRRNWTRWEGLPDTPDRFVQVTDLDEGIGVLHTLLLKKRNYHSMVGGDGSCMGCGEKTGMHLVVATIEAAMAPRVAAFVETLEDLIRRLEERGQRLLAASAHLDGLEDLTELEVDLSPEDRARLARIAGRPVRVAYSR